MRTFDALEADLEVRRSIEALRNIIATIDDETTIHKIESGADLVTRLTRDKSFELRKRRRAEKLKLQFDRK